MRTIPLFLAIFIVVSSSIVLADDRAKFTYWTQEACNGACMSGSEINFSMTVRNDLNYSWISVEKITIVSESNATIAEKYFSGIIPPDTKVDYTLQGVLPKTKNATRLYLTPYFTVRMQNETSPQIYKAASPMEVQLKTKPNEEYIQWIGWIAFLFLVGQYPLYNWVTKKSLGEKFDEYRSGVKKYFDEKYDSFLKEAHSLKQKRASPEEKLKFFEDQSEGLLQVRELYQEYLNFDGWYQKVYLGFGITLFAVGMSFYFELLTGTILFWGEVALYAFLASIIGVTYIGYMIIRFRGKIRKYEMGVPLATFLEDD
jgi:hypothetical protein